MLDESGISISQRNQFQQRPKICPQRTKNLSTKWTFIVALDNNALLKKSDNLFVKKSSICIYFIFLIENMIQRRYWGCIPKNREKPIVIFTYNW